MSHTPEPWFVCESDHEGVGLLIKPVPGMVITELDVSNTMAADARRIVACVNALAGTPVDVVEAMARHLR